MVSFKKFFLAASLLVREVVAAPALQATELDGLAKRAIFEGTDANHVCENQFVTAITIKNNGGSATVVDLTGCTAVFFYLDTTLRRAVHIMCGNERPDAETAAIDAGGSTSVTIAANTQDALDKAIAGVKAGRPELTVNAGILYDTVSVTPTTAVTFRGANGDTALTQSNAPRFCTESG